MNNIINIIEKKISNIRNTHYTDDELKNESIKTIIINELDDILSLIKTDEESYNFAISKLENSNNSFSNPYDDSNWDGE